MVDAGFWRRYVAWSLDAALLGLPIALLSWPRSRTLAATASGDYAALLREAGRSLGDALASGMPPTALAPQWLGDPAMRSVLDALQRSLTGLLWPPLLAFACVGAIYHVVFEASLRQATPGQQLLGLRVTDVGGQRIGAVRALSRHVAGVLSWLTLNLGHALALVSPHKRALHDYIAGTRMQQLPGDAALPPWARAWLGLQLLLLLCATVAWYGITHRGLQAGLEATLGL